jgi:hypothetical protein
MLPILLFWMDFVRAGRDLYQFDETIFAYNGNVVLPIPCSAPLPRR